MRLYLVRHGETNTNVRRQVSSLDGELNRSGIQQAHAIAEVLNGTPTEIILSSPLERARATAEIIAKRKRIPVIVLDFLQEKKLPREIEGRLKNDKAVKVILNRLDRKNAADLLWHYSDEENYFDIVKRTAQVMRYVKQIKQTNIAVVSHEYLIKMLMFTLVFGRQKYPLFRAFYHAMEIDPGSFSICEYRGGLWQITALNRKP